MWWSILTKEVLLAKPEENLSGGVAPSYLGQGSGRWSLRLPDDRAKNPGLVSPGGSPNLRRANLFHAEKDAV